jgi:hypothetical protein
MITLLLIIIAGALNATYEILFTNFKDSIFKDLNLLFWNPQRSWIFKWKQPFYPAEKKWYYFGVYPRYQERFPYSSTILVWTTDAWHLFKALMLGCIMLAIVFYTPLVSLFVDFIIFYLGFTFTFTIFYDYILRKK